MRDPVLNVADYAAALRRAAVGTTNEKRSLKTWQNYVSGARAAHCRVALEFPDRLPSTSMKVLADWLASQLTADGYWTQVDDVANWALGRESERVRRAARVEGKAAEATERAEALQLRNTDLHKRLAEYEPEKKSEIPSRPVFVGYKAAEAATRLYLRQQYTNTSGMMICQACKAELPFKLPNGTYYFEAVEIFNTVEKQFRETFLALCPNHAAMFKYANNQKAMMAELVATASGVEIDVVLAGTATTVQFTEMHLADIKACLKAVEADENTGKAGVPLEPPDRIQLSCTLPTTPTPQVQQARTEIRGGKIITIVRKKFIQ